MEYRGQFHPLTDDRKRKIEQAKRLGLCPLESAIDPAAWLGQNDLSVLMDEYKKMFGEPPPMMIILDVSEIEDAIRTGKRITEKSKGWDGKGTFF
jgi:ribosomal protein S21